MALVVNRQPCAVLKKEEIPKSLEKMFFISRFLKKSGRKTFKDIFIN